MAKWSACLILILLPGCAIAIRDLQGETARKVGGDVLPEMVTVSKVRRGIAYVGWEAETPKGKYSCSADGMVEPLVICNKQAVPAPEPPRKEIDPPRYRVPGIPSCGRLRERC